MDHCPFEDERVWLLPALDTHIPVHTHTHARTDIRTVAYRYTSLGTDRHTKYSLHGRRELRNRIKIGGPHLKEKEKKRNH